MTEPTARELVEEGDALITEMTDLMTKQIVYLEKISATAMDETTKLMFIEAYTAKLDLAVSITKEELVNGLSK